MPATIYTRPEAADNGKCRKCCIMALFITLSVITLAVYLQTGGHQFVYDDEPYVKNNIHVSNGITGDNIIWAFTSVEQANWHPLTWISHMVDVQVYGMDPKGHHLTNVLIHTISSLLLFYLLLRCTGSAWQSSFVAALFALHPMHVESVAWVAERKDVLSAFFGFLSLAFYCHYVSEKKLLPYLLSLFTFILGLLSKPMLVTLPVIMLIVDNWPLNRHHRDKHERKLQTDSRVVVQFIFYLKEKIPFFICSLVSGGITIYAQHRGGAMSSLSIIPLHLRFENALIAYVKYSMKTFWPQDLAVFYPMPSTYPFWQVISSLFLLLMVSVIAILLKRQFPYVFAGWLWFIITLMPVIGLIQVGSQSMADRYSYIPHIGIFMITAWGTADLLKFCKHRKVILSFLGGFVIIAAIMLTWQQLSYWRDNITLYRHALNVTSNNTTMHYNLGSVLAEKGDIRGAIIEYREALRIRPDDTDVLNNLGVALDLSGDFDGAISEYQKALRINAGSADVLNNLGLAFANKGLFDTAIQKYQEALRINPYYSDAYNNMKRARKMKMQLESKE